jgi:transcriptional regulator with XRE-family HTH domain
MPSARKSTVRNLALNLRLLLDKTKWSQAELTRRANEIARKEGLESIDPKTVSNMVHGRTKSSIENADLVARAFGLNLWQIIHPNFVVTWINDGKNLERLIDAYHSTDETGKHSILSVAEMAARYGKD